MARIAFIMMLLAATSMATGCISSTQVEPEFLSICPAPKTTKATATATSQKGVATARAIAIARPDPCTSVPNPKYQKGMSTGTKVGIGLGAGAIALGIVGTILGLVLSSGGDTVNMNQYNGGPPQPH